MLLRRRPEALARTLVFDEGPHEYRLDGVLVPSATTIVAAWHRLCGRELPAFTDFHRDRGHALHAAIEADVLGRLEEIIDSLDPAMQDEVLPRLEANRAWRKLVGFEVVEVEEPDGSITPGVELRMWHPDGVAGTADALALVNGKLCIVDWKHSYIDGAEIQTAGYLRMAEFMFEGVRVEQRWCLRHEMRTTENGNGETATFSPKQYADRSSDTRTFAGALWLYHEAVRRRALRTPGVGAEGKKQNEPSSQRAF